MNSSFENIRIVTCRELPATPAADAIYRLQPAHYSDAAYRARTDRNIGWITAAEQERLRQSVVGIAGCGGMGGLLAAHLLRAGIGEIRIADSEQFEASNLNRQFGATRETLGSSKALETARMLRAITDDTTLVVFPQGISESTANPFLEGCDMVCDEIEFWAIGARILLHEEAAVRTIPLMNCSTVGFGTRLFLFDHTGMNMEDMLGFSLHEANEMQEKITSRTASTAEVQDVLHSVLRALIPELPEYGSAGIGGNRSDCIDRLQKEQTASILGTNPPLATGLVADHVVLFLLDRYRDAHIVRPPRTPGYLYFDAAFMRADVVSRAEIGPSYGE